MLSQIFEVSTNTRIRDLIQNITVKLNLASSDGFSIFVKTHDKVHLTLHIVFHCRLHILFEFIFSSVAFQHIGFTKVSLFQVLSLNDADYFFDSLRQITDWSKNVKRIKDGNKKSCVLWDSWTFDSSP